jgi:hypothetical protein
MTTPSGVRPDLPIACGLDGDAQAQRGDDWATLAARATSRHRSADGVRLEFPADAALAAAIAELAVLEQRCCPFFSFTLGIAAGVVTLDVAAPASAQSMLDALFT